MNRVNRSRLIAQAGMIAAVYGALTIVTVQLLGVLAWGPVQFRVSEAFTVVAFFTPAAVPGLTVGSVVANLYTLATTGSPLALLDVVFGSLGAVATFMFFVYTSAQIMLFGAEVATVYPLVREKKIRQPRFEGMGVPFRVKLFRAVRSLFVREPPPPLGPRR